MDRIDRLIARIGVFAFAAAFFTFAEPTLGPVGFDDGLFGVSEASAQGARRPRGRGNEDQSEGTTSQAVADAYNASLEFLDAEQYGQAIEVLRGALSGANPFEQSILYRLMGQAELGRDDFNQAGDYFRLAIDSGGLEGDDLAALYLILGQIYTAAERYADAISVLEEYFRVVEIPDPQAYFALAQVYTVQERYREAIPYARQAVELAPEFRVIYVRLLLGLYLQESMFTESLPLLFQLLSHDPTEDRDWEALSGVYSQLDRNRDAFAVYQFRYIMGFLDDSRSLTNLADLYMFYEVPFKAAEILERHLSPSAGQVAIERTAENWERLGNAFFAARHFEQSRAALTRAANLSPSGDLYYRIGGTYIQEEDWSQARRFMQRAVDRGGLDRPGLAWMYLGNARYYTDDLDGAEAAFVQAQNFSRTEDDAVRWLEVLSNRRRAEELEAENRLEYEADAASIVEEGEMIALLAEAARGLAREAYENMGLVLQVSESERASLFESARATLAEAREADNAARSPDFRSVNDVRETVRRVASEARADGRDDFAENLEDESERLLERRENALTDSDNLLREAEDRLFQVRQL